MLKSMLAVFLYWWLPRHHSVESGSCLFSWRTNDYLGQTEQVFLSLQVFILLDQNFRGVSTALEWQVPHSPIAPVWVGQIRLLCLIFYHGVCWFWHNCDQLHLLLRCAGPLTYSVITLVFTKITSDQYN